MHLIASIEDPLVIEKILSHGVRATDPYSVLALVPDLQGAPGLWGD